MKLAIIMIMIAVGAYGATPTMRTFNTNIFTTNGGIGIVTGSPTNAGLASADLYNWVFNIPDSAAVALAPVPPGILWNSWPLHGKNVTEAHFKAACDNIYTNGHNYLVFGNPWMILDDSYGPPVSQWATNPPRTASGEPRFDQVRFPSCTDELGGKPLVDYAHARGINVIIYAEIHGIKSVGDMICLTNHTVDANWIAKGGWDGVKMQTRAQVDVDETARLFVSTLLSNRPMLITILSDSPLRQIDGFAAWCVGVVGQQYVFHPGGDPNGTYENQMAFFDAVSDRLNWTSAGHYIYLAWTVAPADSALATNEYRSVLSSRAMAPVPLELANPFFGAGWQEPERTYQKLHFDPDLWALNQDPGNFPARRLTGTTNGPDQEVWLRDMWPPGSRKKTLWFHNKSTNSMEMTVETMHMGYGVNTNGDMGANNLVSGTNIVTFRSLWAKTTTLVTNSHTETVGPRDSRVYFVSPGY